MFPHIVQLPNGSFAVRRIGFGRFEYWQMKDDYWWGGWFVEQATKWVSAENAAQAFRSYKRPVIVRPHVKLVRFL